ncbi:ATP-dependent DNA helicase PIF1-like protein [Tanacetum coccineum]
MGLAASSMAEKRAANLKGKAIADTPNVAPPETGCKTTGASSIPKKITVDLKGKAIADPNNVATTKTGRTMTDLGKKTSKNKRKPAALASSGVEVSYHSLGAPSYQCPNCNATMLYEERNNKANKDQNPTFSLCCQQGKVLLPRFKDTPEPLNRIDHSINKGRGLYTFRINGQNYNRIGSLLPTEGTQPSEEGVDGTIVGSLIRMLDANSAIAKAFRMARDWCHADTTANVELRLLSERTRSKQYNSPTVAEVAALITNDFGDGEPTRDIVVCKKDSPPKRISELHPSYMALQYPLLFPYGEDGYHEKIPYHTNKGKRKTTRDYVTMKEYYAYVIQYRKDQWTTLHRGGRGDTNAAGLGKRIVLPFSFTGGPRCKEATDIDDIISAELPSLTADPVGYKAVSDYMLHGPCRKDNRAAACHVEGKCSKHFPKPFYVETVIDQDGNPIYRSKAIKYLFKYLNKGPDRATIVIQENVQQGQGMTEQKVMVVDEIKNYLNCHYLTPCEAVWRIFSFDIHHSYPSMMKLNFYLPNQQPVTLHDTKCLHALLQKEDIYVTMFTDWFDLNERHPPARNLTYAQIPEHYVWHEQAKKWRPRKQRKCICRIVYSTPSAGEHYFLWMLLNVVRGLGKFEQLLMVNGRICATFKEAYFAYGLLNDDKEWTRAIQEASLWALGPQLRDLIQHQQLYPQLNPEQRLIYEEVVDSVHNKKGQFHFVYGPGGTRKTFLYKTIISRLRSELKIVLAVASSGIASLLLPGGRTAHSRFVIPLELLENSTCGIKQNTHLVELMQQVELIIWDEAPMTQKYAFEALDKTLRDILGYPDPDKQNKIFGGMTVLLGGDFRQILPIIPKGKRADIVQACINRSELWKHCKVSTLKRSMRVNEYNSNGDIDTRKQAFNQWVLAVGDGKVPARIKDGEDEPTWIEIPETFLIPSSESPIQQIVEETYPNFIQRQKDDAYLRERAILTPRNDDADAINAYMFDKLAGQAITYHSADEICKGSTDTLDQHNLYPTEFLNTLNF